MTSLKPFCLIILSLLMIIAFEVSCFAKTPFPQFGVVRQKCSVCHKLDQKGRVEVIEETRKTPEEWKVVVERMIRVNGAPISDADFHPVIKEVSKYLTLTPDETKKVFYITSDENSQYKENPKTDIEKKIYTACVRCHTYGKICSHKKTAEQWVETIKMHLAYQPTVVPQMREMDWPTEAMKLARNELAKKFPFDTREWRKWMANRTLPNISGKWKVCGFQPGMGYYQGEYTFRPNMEKGDDEYFVEKRIRYANGTTLRTTGSGTLYGGYHLRYSLAPTPLTGRVEGVFNLDTTVMGFYGKWWTEIQDTNAYGDESFYMETGSPRVFALFPKSIKASDEPQAVTLVGVNLPELSPSDIKFDDPAIKVIQVEKSGENVVVCQVRAAGAQEGQHSVKIMSAKCGDPASRGVEGFISLSADVLTVYKKLDGIKVFPELGRARVSCGAAYPPQGVQFVARGVAAGKDGKIGTNDDLILEPVNAKWELEEYKTRENDDDLKYLNQPVINGLYTPFTTYGPIEDRPQRREGVGLIAIRATYSEGGRTFSGKALLGVTDPDFIPHIK